MSNKNVNVRKSQEITFCLLAGILMFMAMMVAGRAEAGVALGATRVIYPAGQKQVQLAVTNNDENSTYLIQSWVENADGVKDGRFIVTPLCFPDIQWHKAARHNPASRYALLSGFRLLHLLRQAL